MARHDLIQHAAWFSTGNPQTVNESVPFAPGATGTLAAAPVGTRITIPSGTTHLGQGHFPRVWQFVKLDATSATPAFGQVVCWKDGLETSDYTVITGITAALRSRPAGIVTSSSVTLGNYIWICVAGVAPVLFENAIAAAAGDSLIVGSTTAGRAQAPVAADVLHSSLFGTALGAKTIAFDGSSALPTDTIAALVQFPTFGRV